MHIKINVNCLAIYCKTTVSVKKMNFIRFVESTFTFTLGGQEQLPVFPGLC